MQDFDLWRARADRKASKRMWLGLAMMLISLVVSYLLGSLIDPAEQLAGQIITVLYFVILYPVCAGFWWVIQGSWITWRLHRDPVQFFRDLEGRMP